ncbi:MAG: hypothetical protein JO006_07570 [Paucibacter sp.]|nr:hypothetical protein [Roseateles sp.]
MSKQLAVDRELSVEANAWSLSWQAAVGREFFGSASLAERIRCRLIGAHQRSGRVLLDFVLLPREIHAIARVREDDSVAGVARSFGNIVSRWVREEQPVRSPVLAGPYFSQVLETEEAVRREVRMLAWRPVHLQACATATHYNHGALRAALGLTPARGFNARPLLDHFGDSVPDARKALRKWLAARPSDQEWREWELSHGLELATGSVGPRPAMAKAVGNAAAVLIAAGGGYGVDGALALLEGWVTAKIQPAAPLDLQADLGAAAARGRALVASLAVTHRLCSAASVARHFGRTKSTISEQMALCRARRGDRLIVATPLHRILDELVSLKRMSGNLMHRSASVRSK